MKITSHITFLAFILSSYFLQNFLIFPAEKAIRTDAHLQVVSLLYLPHGFEVLYAVMLGPVALTYIVAANFIAGGIFFGFSIQAFVGAFLGGLAIIIPVALLNASSMKPVWAKPVEYKITRLSVVWTFLTLSLFAALLDSVFHMKLYNDIADIDVFTYFIIGDMTGALLTFILFIGIYRPVMTKILLR